MKLLTSVLLLVFSREDFRNSVRTNKEIIVKLQRTYTDCSHASSFNDCIFKEAVASSSRKRLYEISFQAVHTIFSYVDQAVILNAVI